MIAHIAFAQQKNVTGKVTDDSGEPLLGATILVKGTSTGTSSDFDGNYSINVAEGQTLVFSLIGYKDLERVVGSSNTLNVSMEVSAQALDNVIVVGYGTTTQEAFTGSAKAIASENIEAKSVSNLSQALKGEVAGVSVISGSGAPGSSATVRIRGFGSVNGNQNPLYVVDGVPFDGSISAINVADIENTVVLKDAAATSIYGSRGANGVILITTKQGRANTSNISIEYNSSINKHMLPNYSTVKSPEEYMELSWLSLKNKAALSGVADAGAWASKNVFGNGNGEGIHSKWNIWDAPITDLIDPVTGKFYPGIDRKFDPARWADEAFRTAYRQETNIQFSGGSDKTTYAASLGYLDEDGYAINSNFTRYTGRINLNHQAKDWLNIGGNIAFTEGKYTNTSGSEGSSGSSGNIFALTNSTPAIYDIFLRDADGNRIVDPYFGGYQYDYGTDRRAWNGTNGIADSKYNLSRTLENTVLGNFNLGIDFTDYLKLEVRYGGRYGFNEGTSRQNQYYGGVAGSGTLSKSKTTSTNHNFLQLVRFNKTYGDHSVEAFAAHESTEYKFTSLSAAKENAIIPNSNDLSQYTSTRGQPNSYTQGWALESYFAQANYNYLQKYYVTGSIRRDGSSRFLNDRWGTFGSVGLGWVTSKEDFFDVDFVDYFKLKASYGVIGDQGTNLMYGWQVYNINNTSDGSFSWTESSTMPNPDLTWETSKIGQVGFESALFDNRIFLDVDYYIKNTSNLFFNQSLPGSSGYAQIQYNDGKLRNSGLEFDISSDIIREGEFKLSLGLNGELFNNKITRMPVDYMTGDVKVLDGSLSKGKSLYDFYMREWAGVNPETGAAQWNMYYDDVNNNGVYDAGDVKISSMTTYLDREPGANVQHTTTEVYNDATTKYVGKSAIPKVRGGFRLNMQYKAFDFSAQFSYSLGGYVYDSGYATLMYNRSLIGTDNWHTDMRDSWKQPGDITNVPRMSAGYNTDTNFQDTSTRFLTKADYLALNNLVIGYTLPTSVLEQLNLSRVRFQVSGDNLLMLSKRDGLNPSTMISSGNSGIYMPMTTFTLGAKIDF